MTNNSSAKGELLFLTGCIHPDGMPFTALQDPETRKQQYIDAIRFYLKTTALPVLFVENSGTDISGLFEEERRTGRIEMLTFNGNAYDRKLGKGFGEMLIVEKAVSDSVFLHNAAFVFKITGRYKVLNLTSFIRHYQTQNSVDVLVDLKQQLHYSDSRFWGGTVRFLKEVLLPYKNKINDSENYYFEHALCHAVHEAITKGYAYSALKYKPRLQGVYGTNNEAYNHSLLRWLPENLKQLLKYKAFS